MTVDSPASLPVEWTEYTPRADVVPEYLSVGGMPGVLRDPLLDDARIGQVVSQCVLLSRRDRTRYGIADSHLTSALLFKMLRRGRTPLSTLNVERKALQVHGLLDQVSEFGPDSPGVGWEPQPGTVWRAKPDAVSSIATDRIPFVLDPAFGFDSGSDDSLLQTGEEVWFLNDLADSSTEFPGILLVASFAYRRRGDCQSGHVQLVGRSTRYHDAVERHSDVACCVDRRNGSHPCGVVGGQSNDDRRS